MFNPFIHCFRQKKNQKNNVVTNNCKKNVYLIKYLLTPTVSMLTAIVPFPSSEPPSCNPRNQ